MSVKTLSVRGLMAVVVAMLVTVSPGSAGTPVPTPEEIAAACIVEMNDQYALALDRMTTEYFEFVKAIEALPDQTPVPKVFKAYSAECKRLDAIAKGGTSKILKAGNKCLVKLERLDAEQQLLSDVEGARDDQLESLAMQLRRNYQHAAAQRLSGFVQMN